MLRQNLVVLSLVISTFLFLGCGAGSGGSQASGVAEGQKLYTKVNIWYEKPMKIFPLYHRGAMIPVGSEVTITDTSGKALEFQLNNAQYRIYSRKYYSMSGDEMVSRMFSKTNPKAKGGKFYSFSKAEQSNIEKGKLVVGMSRDAAIMAYGIPPTHVNPDPNGDYWQLWKSRYDKLLVRFKKNKIVEVKD